MKAHGVTLKVGQVWSHVDGLNPTRITQLNAKTRTIRGHDSGWWTLEDWISGHDGLTAATVAPVEDPDTAPIKGIDATIDRIAPFPGPILVKGIEVKPGQVWRFNGFNDHGDDGSEFHSRVPLPANPKAAFGAQKPDLSLIPPVALAHTALAFEEGARKYGPFNWRIDPVEARTYIAAAHRHLGDYLDGTDRASDSDVHNLGHVIACCAILLDAQELGNLIDNRPKPGKSAEVLERLKAWKVERAK